MRNPKRIPIILDLLHANYVEFFKDIGLEEEIDNNFQMRCDLMFQQRAEIEEFWLENPDYRLAQVFIGLQIIENLPGNWFFKEEVDYVIEKGFCNVEDICFWGVNYTKEGVKLPKTEFRLLRDLDTDHIRNIIKFFEEHDGGTSGINKSYLKYFQQRILAENSSQTDDLINNL